jgi:NADH-quinone oxidoreductase subunit N
LTTDEQLVNETTQKSLGHFSPEIALCVTMVGLLLVRLCNADRLMPGYWVALIGSLVAFGLAFYQFDQLKQVGGIFEEPFFTGLLVYDTFMLLFLILVIALTVLSGIPDVEDGPDFYTLLLGSVVGMMLMSSANHLLILFLGVEMASVPSYVMVGFMKGRRVSSWGRPI